MSRTITVTYDYRCPFARNAHEAIAAAIESGTDIDWAFSPFFLDQSTVGSDTPPLWEQPAGARGTGALALEWSVVIRDQFPDRFLSWHVGAFAARFDRGLHIEDPTVVREVATAAGVDVEAVAAAVSTGAPLAAAGRAHTDVVDRYDVFGVPTFIENDVATFIRFMERGRVDDLDRAVDLLEWTRLNEFKRTRLTS